MAYNKAQQKFDRSIRDAGNGRSPTLCHWEQQQRNERIAAGATGTAHEMLCRNEDDLEGFAHGFKVWKYRQESEAAAADAISRGLTLEQFLEERRAMRLTG